MNVRRFFPAGILLLLAGCFGPLEVSKVTPGSKEFDRLPEIMRQFPIWQPIDTPLYDFEARDGARRPSGGIRYTSKLPPDTILENFTAYAATLDCQMSLSEPRQAHFICGNDPASALELHVSPAPAATSGPASASDVGIVFLQTTAEFEQVSF